MSRPRRLPWLSKVLGPRTVAPGAGHRTPAMHAGPAAQATPAEIATPVTHDRISNYLHERGYFFTVDEDGDITGTWDGNRFWFMLLGTEKDIVQVRGRWHRSLSTAGRMSALQVINDWNRDRIWPKAYIRDEGDVLGLYTELSLDLGPGATKDQLDQVIACGLATAVQLFSTVSSMLPADLQEGTDDEE